jgi:hypothetical protein
MSLGTGTAGGGLSTGLGSPGGVLKGVNQMLGGISNKSTTTETGKMYNMLSNKLRQWNRQVESGPALTPTQVMSPKIVDTREASLFAGYSLPEPDPAHASDSVETTPERIYGQE